MIFFNNGIKNDNNCLKINYERVFRISSELVGGFYSTLAN